MHQQLFQAEMAAQQEEISFLRNWRIKEGDIKWKERLAQGSEGEVWLGSLSGHEKPVAIKKAHFTGGEKTNTWDEREVAFLMYLKHPRLVVFVGAGQCDAKGIDEQVVFVVQEYMSGGSIDKPLWGTARHTLTWLTWACDVAEAMAFIHEKGYTHRDLKSQNILYDLQDWRAKVTDFGMSRAIGKRTKSKRHRATDLLHNVASVVWHHAEEEGESDMKRTRSYDTTYMTAQCGTAQWMAPELCEVEVAIRAKLDDAKAGDKASMMSFYRFENEHKQAEYGQPIDCYAFGVMLWEMLVHQAPWRGVSQVDVFSKVAAGDRLAVPSEVDIPDTPPEYAELMQACWDSNPDARPSFNEMYAQLAAMKETEDASEAALHRSIPILRRAVSNLAPSRRNSATAEESSLGLNLSRTFSSFKNRLSPSLSARSPQQSTSTAQLDPPAMELYGRGQAVQEVGNMQDATIQV